MKQQHVVRLLHGKPASLGFMVHVGEWVGSKMNDHAKKKK